MRRYSSMYSSARLFLVTTFAGIALGGCSSDSSQSGNEGDAGASSVGGSASGGKTSTGGKSSVSSTIATQGGSAGSSTGTGATTSGGTSSNGGTSAGSTTATGGVSTVGGSSNVGGSATGGVSTVGGSSNVGGSATGGVSTVPSIARPQLTTAQAANYEIVDYLAKAGTLGALVTDNWDPTTGIGDVTALTPDYTVSATGTFTTVQAAINAAVTAGGVTRKSILITEGKYREIVRVPSNAPPLTLYSTNSDASKTVIAFNNYNGKTYNSTTDVVPTGCIAPSSTATTWGTSGSSTFGICGSKVWLKNLMIANDYDEGTTTAGIAAVALTVQGDQAVFENVRFVGNQDTLQVKTSAATGVARSYFKSCYIEGDTDFIFGRGTAVFDNTTIHYVSVRRIAAAQSAGVILAPSTLPTNDYGFLVINSSFTADATTTANSVSLGRAWDEGTTATTYTLGTSPNGQVIVRNSTLGAHLRLTDPWDKAASSSRLFDSNTNRLFEYQNTGGGAAP